MSKLKILRKKVRYETDVPRCDNCRHFKRAHSWLKDSMPQKGQHFCGAHHFTVHPLAVCDTWQDRKTGGQLEAA